MLIPHTILFNVAKKHPSLINKSMHLDLRKKKDLLINYYKLL